MGDRALGQLVAVRYLVRGTIPRGRPQDGVYIEQREQRDGSVRWIVTCLREVMNRAGEWEWEPQPSSREDDFIARTRFPSVAVALQVYENSPNKHPYT